MRERNRPFLIRGLVLVGLLALFAQLTAAIPHLSVTYDEPIYTAIGYADLTAGDFYWHSVIGHGPLVNMLAAWPLLLGPRHIDVTQLPSWGSDSSLGLGREVLAALGPLRATLVATRVPIAWLTMLLAAFVFRWARQRWGAAVGCAALLFVAFEPNLIAHGQLNTTDMGVTLFGFVGAYWLSCYLRRPRPLPYVGAGLALGAAVASKTSGLFWAGAYGLILLAVGVGRGRASSDGIGASLVRWGVRAAGLLGLGVLALWACYGFEVGPLAPGGIPLPAPSHWTGLVYQRANLTEGQTTFLAGERYPGGHWLYFPVTLLLKTPLPLLIGIAVGLYVAVRRGLGPSWQAWPLILPPVAYLALSMLANLNIGHRHLLPILPFLVLWAAQAARPIVDAPGRGRRWWALGAAVLTAWTVIGTASVFPHYLTFFNRLAGGPDGGYRYLADSSIDWGQGFYALRAYLEERDASGTGAGSALPVKLAAFSSIDPSWYGIDVEPLPPTPSAPVRLPSRFRPAPGLYVISVVPLQGIWTLDPDTYDWFRHREPTARVAHVFHVYEVRGTARPLDRIAQCAAPAPPLDESALATGFGDGIDAGTARHTFDCTGGWLYPGDGGRLVVPGAVRGTPWVERRAADMRVVVRQDAHWSHPALDLYGPADAEGAQPPRDAVVLAPAGETPAQILEQGTPVRGPVATSGPLTFLGYEMQADRAAVILATFWRVNDPAPRPLSLMAHLLDREGAVIGVADGLSVPIEAWVPGDVIVQRHALAREALGDRTGYWVVGGYWLDTMARWSMGGESASVDRVLVPEGVE